MAKPAIKDLATETDTRVQISVEEFGVLVVLAIEHGDRVVAAQARVGKRDYLHCAVSGKAILVHMPRDRIEETIDHHVLPKRTPNTIADPEALFEELEEIRSRDTRSTHRNNTRERRRSRAALSGRTGRSSERSISEPAARFDAEYIGEMAELEKEAANKIERSATSPESSRSSLPNSRKGG